MMQYFESVASINGYKQQADPTRWYAEGDGVHWKKYGNEAERLASMGITACWLPRTSNS